MYPRTVLAWTLGSRRLEKAWWILARRHWVVEVELCCSPMIPSAPFSTSVSFSLSLDVVSLSPSPPQFPSNSTPSKVIGIPKSRFSTPAFPIPRGQQLFAICQCDNKLIVTSPWQLYLDNFNKLLFSSNEPVIAEISGNNTKQTMRRGMERGGERGRERRKRIDG